MTIFAQAIDLAPLLASLAPAGIPGLMLAWFMFRNEQKLSAIEHAIDRMTRGTLVLAMASSNSDAVAHREMQKLLTECDEAASRRKPR